MPLPKPKKGESQKDFISRMMADEKMMSEYPDEKQRAAVAHSQWKEKLGTNIDLLTPNASKGYTSRYEQFDGRQHLVVPVVLLKEGVHNGLYYPPQELEKFPESWNGVPIPLHHPKNAEGQHVSANAPDVIRERVVGRVFNVSYDSEGRALKGEAWLDEGKLKALEPDLLKLLQAGEQIEVSTGLWTEGDGVKGQWNEEDFTATVRHFRPDHLALLPGARGACSCADGCGIRANQEDAVDRYLIANLNADDSLDALREKVSQAVSAYNSPSNVPGTVGTWYSIRSLFDGEVVIVEYKDQAAPRIWLAEYELAEDSASVTLSPKPEWEEVKESIEYKALTANEGCGCPLLVKAEAAAEEFRANHMMGKHSQASHGGRLGTKTHGSQFGASGVKSAASSLKKSGDADEYLGFMRKARDNPAGFAKVGTGNKAHIAAIKHGLIEQVGMKGGKPLFRTTRKGNAVLEHFGKS